MHTIKPIDKNMILREIKNKKNIFTVEEHNILGGLGSAVSEVISEVRNNECVLTRIGIKDSYTLCGNYEFMLKQNHLDALSIKNTVVKTLKTIN
jgi:transketolase